MDKHRLIIISAGSFGREVRDIAVGIQMILGDKCPWKFTGFLDNRAEILDGTNSVDESILCSPIDYIPCNNDLFICAIGNPGIRHKYAEMIRAKGGKFATLIEPSSRIGRVGKIGEGVLIGPFCAISCDLRIGNDTMITNHATIGHDATIGCSCHIGAYTFVGGGAVIGNEVTMHPHAVILPRVKVGDGATIGAGAVVIADVDEGQTVFGVPARRVAL
jgi:sugar O-acyltransferase (sialic acid O-acetyltransferase NeuD family)